MDFEKKLFSVIVWFYDTLQLQFYDTSLIYKNFFRLVAIVASARASLRFSPIQPKDEGRAGPSLSHPRRCSIFISAVHTALSFIKKAKRIYLHSEIWHFYALVCCILQNGNSIPPSRHPPAMNEKISYEMRIHKARNMYTSRCMRVCGVCCVYATLLAIYADIHLHTTHGRYFDT